MESKSLITDTYPIVGLDEKDATGTPRRLRPTDPDVFSNPDSARVRARQINCIGIRKYDSISGGYVWMPCTNESDYRRQIGTSHSGRLQRRQEIQDEIRRFVRGKGHDDVDQKSGAYTKPEMREKIKNRIMAGSKGGKPGQWSARKAQLLAQEYRKSGGGYKGGRTRTQRSLSRWSKEKWTTSSGKPANQSGGMRRYLPQAAWAKLTPGQVRAANRKKIQGSKLGSQYVRNTEAAMEAARSSQKQILELMISEKALGRGVGSYAASRAIDRPRIGRRKRGRGVVATGGMAGTAKPTGSRISRDDDGWADEGTTNPVWVGLPSDNPQMMPAVPEEQPVPEKVPEPVPQRVPQPVRPPIPQPLRPRTPSVPVPTRLRESAAERMRQIDSPNVVGPVVGAFRFRYKENYRLIKQSTDNGAKVIEGAGKGSHLRLKRRVPDGTKGIMKNIFTTVNSTVAYDALRFQLIEHGFITAEQVPYKPTKKINAFSAIDKNIIKKILDDITEAKNIELSSDGYVTEFPGVRAIALKVREQLQRPIPTEDVANFLRDEKENPILARAINRTDRKLQEIGQKEAVWSEWRELIFERLRSVGLSKKRQPILNPETLDWLNDIPQVDNFWNMWLRPEILANEKLYPEEILDFAKSYRDKRAPKKILSKDYLGVNPIDSLSSDDQKVFYGWNRSLDLDRDPFSGISPDALDSIYLDLNQLQAQPPQKGIYSDTSVNAEVLQLHRDLYNAELSPQFFEAITNPDRKVSAQFYEFAVWRQKEIDAGRYIDDIDDMGDVVGPVIGSMGSGRGNGSRRRIRRSDSGGVVGAMAATPDDRRRDFAIKKRRWQAGIISQAVLDNQSRLERVKNDPTNTETALFPEFMNRFQYAELQSITGLGAGQAWAHRVIDELFGEMVKEWGPNETLAYGELKPFNLWDSPMSALDIENLEENKRTIAKEFIEEAIKLDPNSPFAEYDVNQMEDKDVDMLWKVFIVPELLKTDGMASKEPLPFVLDLDTAESLRNYAEYRTMKRLGLENGVSDKEFQDAIDELFVDAPAYEFRKFIEELNESYDKFKSTGLLPGDFLHTELIDPSTDRFYTKEKWRELFTEASNKYVEVNNDYFPNVERDKAGDAYMGWFNIGLHLGYITPEDIENGKEQADDLEEIDPLPDLDPKDLHFDPSASTKIKNMPGFGWIYRTFGTNAKDWAYSLAEIYHPYDIQQERYTPGLKEEIAQFDKYDWDNLYELIKREEAGETETDEDLPFSGRTSRYEKLREQKGKAAKAQQKLLDGKNATSKALVDSIWDLFTTDGLTDEEIAAKMQYEPLVVSSVLKRESKARGMARSAFNNQQKINTQGMKNREDGFQTDLVAAELARLKKLGTDADGYLDDLRSSLENYKNINKQANASYSRERARFASLATLGRKLVEGAPDGRKEWDPNKESAASFKNRWLKYISQNQPALALISAQITAQGWDEGGRRSASKRILDRSRRMIDQIKEEIEKIENLKKMSDVERIRARHQIISLSAAREAAKKAVQGLYPKLTEDEVQTLLNDGGVTGKMAAGLRGAMAGRKAKKLTEYSERNRWDKRGALRRAADRFSGAKARPRVMRVVDLLDNPDNVLSVGNQRPARNRRNIGTAATDSTPRMDKMRIAKLLGRINNQDFGQKRSSAERAQIKELRRNARKLKVNIDRYFTAEDDDEDVKWSSNDWSYAKKSPIRGADMVIYRKNPNIKNPEQAIEVLVISRRSGPFTGAKALPGGLNDAGETLIETATREMNEEVGISADGRKVVNLGIVQSRDWDPRFVEGVTVQGISIEVPYEQVAVAGSDAMKADWVTLGELINGDSHIAFGHASFMKEAFQSQAPVTSEKLAIHEKAARIRNRRLIEKINAKRSQAGQKLFPVASDEDVKNSFDLIRPTDPRYIVANDPESGIRGAMAGGSSERYDIRVNDDKTFSIIDTQNNNLIIAGPFPTRNQALYAAIKKDRDPSFDPQRWVRKPKSTKSKRKNKAKKTRTKINAAQAPVEINEQLSFDDIWRLEKVDKQTQGGVTGKMSAPEMLAKINMQAPDDSNVDPNQDTMTTHGWDNKAKGPMSGADISVSPARHSELWVPYTSAVQNIVPDSAATAAPIFFIIGGHPGSLKSSIREIGQAGIPDRTKAITVDPDEAKLVMPEWTPMGNMAGSQTHSESVALSAYTLSEVVAEQVAKLKFSKQGKDIVHDSIGRLEKSELISPARAAKDGGYNVVVYYFITDQSEAQKRVSFRAKMTGRRIQSGAWQSAHNSLKNSFRGLTQASNQSPNRSDISGLADVVYVYDTTNADDIKRIAVWSSKTLDELESMFGTAYRQELETQYTVAANQSRRTAGSAGQTWRLNNANFRLTPASYNIVP